MALLPVAQPGEPLQFQAADPAGDEFRNSGDTRVWILNQGGAIVRTDVARGRCRHGFLDDRTENLAGGGFLGLSASFADHARFNDDQGRARITYSDAAGVQVAAQRLS